MKTKDFFNFYDQVPQSLMIYCIKHS